ncbi:MAG: A/G-specific adenine glycosylase [Alphaproteobacteria bacterium]|jgi:A/G-specific adenine glycosylase
MLDWYDIHARKLPWRISPQAYMHGERANPYYIWLSEIMLQQTTVATVTAYYQKFIQKWPNIHDLAGATQDDVLTEWAGLGYYSRARNLHKTAQMIVNDYQGNLPQDEQELLKLSGIGRYSAASIAAIAFNIPAAVMDGNIERIISRLYCVKTPLPQAKNDLYALIKALTPSKNAGDYAQAMMDLGATICKPKKPLCDICPINQHCQAYLKDNPELYPVKIPKAKKPTHEGVIFLIIHDGKIMLQRRPDKGLFAGMEIFPYYNPHEDKKTSQNNSFASIATASPVDKIVDNFVEKPISRQIIGRIKHVFTHFTLLADIMVIELACADTSISDTRFVGLHALNQVALPTLMTKAFKIYQDIYINPKILI